MIKKYPEPILETYSNQLVKLYPDYFSNLFSVLTLTFQVTEDCCMACTYCYQHHKTKNKMSFEVAQKIIDNLLIDDSIYHTENINGIILEFIGGEPFLEIELIDQIVDYFLTKGTLLRHRFIEHFRISMASNGLLYFSESVQSFIKKYKAFLSLTISIDGNKELHDTCRLDLNGKGTYDKAIAAAMDLQKYIPNLETKMTLSPENIHFTFNAITNLISLGYQFISLNCVFEEGWTLDHAKVLYQELKKTADWLFDTDSFQKYNISLFNKNLFSPLTPEDNNNWCGGAGNKQSMLSFNYKGQAFPCVRYMESSLNNHQPPFQIGNVDGLYLTEEEQKRKELLHTITRQSQSSEECINCQVGKGCGWCNGYNYECFGTPNKRTTFICWMHKARSLANAYYYNKGNFLAKDNERIVIYLPKTDALQIISLREWEEIKYYEQNFSI